VDLKLTHDLELIFLEIHYYLLKHNISFLRD